MLRFKEMSTAELLVEEKLLRARSHDAPRSEPPDDHDAWARWSREWGACVDEIKRRERK